ncbi:autotransporter assembly complex protein TamA [Hydrogenimonas urashimensis]|uniref:autotransporter assembly complex protein TamA n=1 Tax=Hydrogenimonas urashimensis TaxID=2740515 RepID=UPI0019160824|nr:outer membrane protein assembly factor [Hydrogenimonas urashimensis]
MKRVLAFSLFFVQLLSAVPLPVKFRGNDHIEESRLYEVMGIPKPLFFEFWKKKPKIDPTKVNALLPAIEEYYKSHGFYHTRASSRIEKNRIIIDIVENVPIRVADVSAVSTLDIEKIIPFHPGDRFDAELFVKSKEKIKRYYRDNHFCNVYLDAKAFVDIEKNEAYIVYDVHPNDPCVFGKITIHTPPTVDERIIRSLLMFRSGEPYSAELIRRSYREIYANEGIERVIIDDTKHQGNEVPVNITVTVYTKPVHFTAGAGYSSDEGINLQMGVKHRNFFGNLKTVGIDTRYSQIKQYVRTTAEMPLAHHNRLGMEAGVKKEIFDGYDEYSILASFNLKHIRHPHYFQEGIIFDRSDTRNSNDPVNFPNGKLTIVSPGLRWEVDRRDSFLDPTQGYRIELEGKGSVKCYVSDATYYKIMGSASYHKSVDWGIVSTRLKLGSIDVMTGRIPPSYRFYAGGMNSNRAYNYRRLGPKNRYGDPIGAYSIAEGTLEFRIPLGDNFRWVLFSDVTFLGQDAFPDFGKSYIAVGPGIRYLTPMGPIALDVGFDVEDFGQFAFHFHIGELF